MTGNLVLAITSTAIGMAGLVTGVWSLERNAPEWLVAVTDDRVAFPFSVPIAVVGLALAWRAESPIVLACVMLGGVALHIVISLVRLRRIRRRAGATDA